MALWKGSPSTCSAQVFTAPSKEALQLSLLALSIRGVRDERVSSRAKVPFPYTEAETEQVRALPGVNVQGIPERAMPFYEFGGCVQFCFC